MKKFKSKGALKNNQGVVKDNWDEIVTHWRYRLNYKLDALLKRNRKRDIWEGPSWCEGIYQTLTSEIILSKSPNFIASVFKAICAPKHH